MIFIPIPWFRSKGNHNSEIDFGSNHKQSEPETRNLKHIIVSVASHSYKTVNDNKQSQNVRNLKKFSKKFVSFNKSNVNLQSKSQMLHDSTKLQKDKYELHSEDNKNE